MAEAVERRVGTLKGFSGSCLSIIRDDHTFVRKHVDNREKMVGEIAKLHHLSDLCNDGYGAFDVPVVWDEADESYDLEYIRGFTVEEYLQTCTVDELNDMARKFALIVTLMASQDQEATTAARDLYLIQCLKEVDGLYDVHAVGSKIASSVFSKDTFCHGDLTLDNAIVGTDGMVYLIDPLINQHETYMWDVAKVLQSFYADWYQIRTAEIGAAKSNQRSQRLRMFARAFLNNLPPYIDLEVTALYLAVVLLRIVKHAPLPDQREVLRDRACVMLSQFMGEREPFNMEDATWT